MTHASTRRAYRFGDCRIDLSARELRRAGELVVLSPKVFDCLTYLIERRERAVGRDELVAAVWGRAEITDTLLGQTILKARRAVGDSADEQKAIRTIPRFGYTWVAELVADAEGESPATDARPARGRRAGGRRIAWLATAAIAASVVAWAAYRIAHRDAAVPAASGSAAVLPVDVSAPAEWSWVRLGLMDAIATRLREGDQAVVPSDNVVALVGASTQADHAADVRGATGAGLVIAPSATWNPDGWSVHLELQGGAAAIAVAARDIDVLLAGRAAADRLLARLGKTPPADAGDPQQWSDAKLLQRVEAALLTGDLDGARSLLQSAPDSLQQSPEFGLRLAKIDFRAGQFDDADRRLRLLLAHAAAEREPALRARILNGIGHVAVRLGRPDAAKAAYLEAAMLLKDRNEPAELGQANMGLGIVAQMQGRYDEARAGYSQAHIAFELAGDGLALARIEANEGMLESAHERYAAAVTALDAAARRFERFGAWNELAMTTNAEVAARLALLEPGEALSASDRAWPVRERVSNPRIRHALAIHRARALDASGRRRDAVALLQSVAADAESESEAETATLAAVRGELARIELASGRAQQAADLALAALPLPDAQDADVRGRLGAWLTGIRALRAVGRPKDAAEQVERLGDWARSHPQPAAVLYASLARAERYAAEAQDAAYAEYDRALGLAFKTSVPADIAQIAVSYGTHLIAARRLEQATAVVGQIIRWTDRDLECALLRARLYSALGQRDAWRDALSAARALAGDRDIPQDLIVFPGDATAANP